MPATTTLMRMFRILFSIYAAILFLALMLLIFPFVIAASFFGPVRGGNIIYRLCTAWADIWFALVCIHVHKIYDSPYTKNNKQIIVANHISYLDIPMLVKIFRKPLRPLGKIEMTRIPVFGFIYKNAIVTVDRSDARHRSASLKMLQSVLSRGISVFIFPEGTFNETNAPLSQFYNGAFKLAVETGIPIQPVLFLDTYRRMHFSSIFSLNPGRSRVVYLQEISVEGITDFQILKEKVFLEMDKKLREYKAGWIQE